MSGAGFIGNARGRSSLYSQCAKIQWSFTIIIMVRTEQK